MTAGARAGGYDGAVPSAPLRLREVTVCAADSVSPALAARALERCVARCDFGDAVLFTDASVAGNFRTVSIEPLRSRADYSRFILKDLPAHVATTYVLVVQWDGYVVDPAAWLPDFLRYDYVGAKWPWHTDGFTVGNGGFSLRSRRLLDAGADPRISLDSGLGEDKILCRLYRQPLEAQFGLRFAPESVADCFSHERSPPAGPTFGFHGLFNLWRHEDDAELVALAARVPDAVLATEEYAELFAHCFARQRRLASDAFYSRLRAVKSPEAIEAQLASAIREADFIARCVRESEARFSPARA
jgi:hypothetical protein